LTGLQDKLSVWDNQQCRGKRTSIKMLKNTPKVIELKKTEMSNRKIAEK